MTPCVWLSLRLYRNRGQRLEIGAVTSMRPGFFEQPPIPGSSGKYRWKAVSPEAAKIIYSREDAGSVEQRDLVSVIDEDGTLRTMRQARDLRISREI